MKNNNKLKLFICIIISAFFGISFVDKTFQNDVFFTIPLGQNILKNGYTIAEQLTYHSDFTFVNVRWLFDIVIALIYNKYYYLGIHLFTLFITSIISIILFYIGYKNIKNKTVCLCFLFLTLYVIKAFFVSRAQIVSIIIFILQYYCSCELLKTNKKRYYFVLLLLPIILVNIHGSVFPTFFIFYLPFIVEYLISKNIKLSSRLQGLDFDNNNNYYKGLLLVIFLNLFEGLLSPNGLYPYTMMFKTTGGYSTILINEMKPITLSFIPAFLVFLAIFFANPQKLKAHSAFMFLGLAIMGIATRRSLFYFFTIGFIILSEFLMQILIPIFENSKLKKLSEKNIKIASYIIIIILCTCSIISFFMKSNHPYLYLNDYPINATNYLKENIDLSKEKLFNDFNVGSYLEYNGIKTFMDSRAEVFEKPFNDTTILKDFSDAFINKDKLNYKEFFEKYEFTIALIDKSMALYKNKQNELNDEYITLYEDDYFVIYRIKE